MIDDAFIQRWTDRLRADVADAVAVLLKGSYARGDAGPFSDVDFDVLTAGEPQSDYRAFLEEHHGRLVHVSVAIWDLASWLADEAEPAPWAFSLPTEEAMRLLWLGDESVRPHVDRAALRHPPGDAELEDFVADLGKIRNAYARGDDLAVRLNAQGLARLCPSVLRLINPEIVTRTHEEALRAVLSFPVAPPGYRDDMLVCLGLTGHATTIDDVAAAAGRLVAGVLALVRPHADRLAAAFEPDLPVFLADGTLQRLIAG